MHIQLLGSLLLRATIATEIQKKISLLRSPFSQADFKDVTGEEVLQGMLGKPAGLWMWPSEKRVNINVRKATDMF